MKLNIVLDFEYFVSLTIDNWRDNISEVSMLEEAFKKKKRKEDNYI